MRLLFVQGGSRWKFDSDGNAYTDTNFNEHIWNRYRGYCDELTVMLRRDQVIYNPQEAIERFNKFDTGCSSLVALPDLYRPVKNIFNISVRRYIEKVIDEEIGRADKIIIRSLGNIYTNTALKCAQKYHKLYLVEVTGFAREGLWYHSFRGKLVAWPKEFQYRRLMKDVPYAVYVTNEALQKRYPCKGFSIGCSDVEIEEMKDQILEKRLEKIWADGTTLIIGTAAHVDVKFKGHESVLKAMRILKDKYNLEVRYEIIGGGNPSRLKAISQKLGVDEQVRFLGLLPHDKTFEWYDHIDIYVHPSFSEGLCRSIIEAMSRALPVIACDVGGNYELIEREFLFAKGNYHQLADIMQEMIKPNLRLEQAKRNFERALLFSKTTLDLKRDIFYKEFANGE